MKKGPTFVAKLEPVPHGGNFVVVPEKVAKAAGLKHSMRVRGTVNGAPRGRRFSLKREHVKSVLEAKKAETRARRIEKVVASLETN